MVNQIQKLLVCSLVIGLCSTSLLYDASACKLPKYTLFQVEKQKGKKSTLPVPKKVEVVLDHVRRGETNEVNVSCRRYGRLGFMISSKEQNDVGYRIDVVEGLLPKTLARRFKDRTLQSSAGRLFFSWDDPPKSHKRRPMAFKVVVTPVNRHGIEGPKSDVIEIKVPANK